MVHVSHWAKIFKQVQAKKTREIKFQIDQIPFFAISKMAKNQFLNWGKKFKTEYFP